MLKRISLAVSLAVGMLAVGMLAAAAPVRAQGLRPVPSASLFQFTPYVGYMIFGNFLDGPFGTSLSTNNGPVYGAQLGMQIAPHVSLVGNVAYSNSSLRVGVPFFGAFGVGSTSLWLYDGDVQFDIPVDQNGVSPISPFVQVGAGAMHYSIDAVTVLRTTATNFAFNAGAGLDYRVTPTLAARVMVKDYIGKFNFQDATSLDLHGRTAQNWALTGGLRVGF